MSLVGKLKSVRFSFIFAYTFISNHNSIAPLALAFESKRVGPNIIRALKSDFNFNLQIFLCV